MQLKYVKDTIRDMQETFSEKNKLKFGIEDTENCVQSVVSIAAMCVTSIVSIRILPF